MTAQTLDLVLLGVLLLSAIVGIWRGLTFEVLSLIGWVVAYIAAQALNPVVVPMLPIGTPGSALNHGAAFAITFILVLVIWSLLARLVRALIHATPLSGLDRFLGALFGVLRGAVLLLAVATLILLTPMKNSSSWQQSQLAQALTIALRGLKPLLPADLAQHLPA
jgi:membrane protein required for colicin V production